MGHGARQHVAHRSVAVCSGDINRVASQPEREPNGSQNSVRQFVNSFQSRAHHRATSHRDKDALFALSLRRVDLDQQPDQ